MKEPVYSISAVERDVGISKDVLRVWERRYGFPRPERDARGERTYPAEQVRRLRLVKRLMDLGHRPGRLLAADAGELELALARGRAEASPPADAAGDLQDLLDLLGGDDAPACAHALQQRLARQGLRLFVLDTIAPLSILVGEAWEQGRLQVFEEHLFTEIAERLLRQAIAAVPRGRGPQVMLTTLPGEMHGLGLLMVEALLVLEGAQCVSLGTQTPVPDIAQAARAWNADVVAVSFSAAFAQRQAQAALQQLRDALPPAVQLWAGGAAVRALRQVPDVRILPDLPAAEAALRDAPAQRAAARP